MNPLWINAIIGGALIGAASGGLMLGLGRIAGVSGVLGGLVKPQAGEWGWRLAFVAGMALAGTVATLAGWWEASAAPQSGGLLIGAGLLTGIGTTLASGCTSGHGVCGMALLSTRSFAAVASFLGTGFIVTYALRHLGAGS